MCSGRNLSYLSCNHTAARHTICMSVCIPWHLYIVIQTSDRTPWKSEWLATGSPGLADSCLYLTAVHYARHPKFQVYYTVQTLFIIMNSLNKFFKSIYSRDYACPFTHLSVLQIKFYTGGPHWSCKENIILALHITKIKIHWFSKKLLVTQNIGLIKIYTFHLKHFPIWWILNEILGKIISDSVHCDTCPVIIFAMTDSYLQ
jgi:hypothetical protein